jgi:hypothetical protein
MDGSSRSLLALIAGYLDLTNGGFHGELPAEPGLLRKLRFLYLPAIRFTVTVPSELGSIPNLRTLLCCVA